MKYVSSLVSSCQRKWLGATVCSFPPSWMRLSVSFSQVVDHCNRKNYNMSHFLQNAKDSSQLLPRAGAAGRCDAISWYQSKWILFPFCVDVCKWLGLLAISWFSHPPGGNWRRKATSVLDSGHHHGTTQPAFTKLGAESLVSSRISSAFPKTSKTFIHRCASLCVPVIWSDFLSIIVASMLTFVLFQLGKHPAPFSRWT